MDILSLKLIMAVCFSFLVAQSAKIINESRSNKFSWSLLFKEGGMPSSHTSSITALCTSLFIIQGWSLLFISITVLGIVLIRDAFNFNDSIRRHTLLEILVGFIIGLTIPFLFF